MFLRIGFNDKGLSEYISALCYNDGVTDNYYEKNSIVRDMLTSIKVVEIIQKLTSHINFRLLIKDKKLDIPNYWELVYVLFIFHLFLSFLYFLTVLVI